MKQNSTIMNNEQINTNNGEIILYQPDSNIRLEVRMQEETVWLNLIQMSQLFGRDKSVISRHIRNIFQERELLREATVAKFATVQIENGRDVLRQIDYYNLDIIISVGYRVKSLRGTQFRQWANSVLKDYLLRGYAINQHSETLSVDLARHNQQYPPVEILTSDRYHDRFLIIDNTVYHLGASLKDLGKKLFAFSRMEVTAEELLNENNKP